MHFVVGLGEHERLAGDRLGLPVALLVLLEDLLHAGAEFVQRERVLESLEHLPVEVARKAKFLELALEEPLLVRSVGHLRRLKAIAGWRIDRDVAGRVEEPGAEGDRRDMAFARRPQAQDEAQGAGRKVRLVRMQHDRGVEQGGGFERILVSEIGREQQFPLFG